LLRGALRKSRQDNTISVTSTPAPASCRRRLGTAPGGGDSFGYVSNATDDFRFGGVATSTDENGQLITNNYDNFGRLIHVTGPYEQIAKGAPTTIDITYPDTSSHRRQRRRRRHRCRSSRRRQPYRHPAGLLARGRHPATDCPNHIETVLLTDGLKRVLQTKKEAYAIDPRRPRAAARPT
jgi:hypothetical protein